MRTPSAVRLLRGTVTVLSAVALLAACGGDKGKAATQAAARVNDKGEITVHQINQVLQQQPGLRPEQVDTVSRQVLEKLIDQELAIEQAEEKKIDRQPTVVAAIEAARRDIIARAFAEQVASGVAKPTPQEVEKYFADKPELFAKRRIYSLLELNVEAPPARHAEIADKVKASKSFEDLGAWLQSQNLRSGSQRVNQPAENLPLDLLARLAPLSAGQAVLLPQPASLKVIVVQAAQEEPVTLAQARPAIEQFIANERKLQAVQAEQKRLRDAAKVEYLGKFAQATSAPAGAEAASQVVPAAAPAPTRAASPADSTAAPGGLAPDAVKKGLGLK